MEQTHIDNTFRYLNSKILIIGKRESGKTSLVRDIYQKIQNELSEVHVFSNVTSCYSDITHAIYDDFNLLHDFLAHCHDRPDINKLVIIENVINREQIKLLEDLLFRARHYNVTLIVTIQHPIAMMPEHKNQFNYIFTAYHDFVADQKTLHDIYFYMYPSFDYFQQQLNKLKEFEFMGVKIQSSPYVIVHKPNLHTKLRFIQTQKINNNSETQKININNRNDKTELDQMVDIIGDMIASLSRLTNLVEKIKNKNNK